ncbi:MAG: ATP synthase F1 subunit gamma [Erysipelotrichaceae bacterium]
MAVNKQAIKARIRSINATKKITSAMELIANAKLAKQRNMMEKNREYATLLKSTVNAIVLENGRLDHTFLKEKKSNKRIVFVFSSDLGLCGGYNTNMVKLAKNELLQDDELIVIGHKQRKAYHKQGFNILNDSVNGDAITFDELKELSNIAIEKFRKDEVSSIHVLFTEFVNTVTFEPSFQTIIPTIIEKEQAASMHKETIFEPNAEEILDYLVPMMIQNVIYSIWLQSKTAEQASRRLAMENATDNAEELNDKLVLTYNQARQAAITQEITEIVGGADAL